MRRSQRALSVLVREIAWIGQNKKGTNAKSTQGQGGSSKQGSKKSGGTVPIEKMRFMPGENQAENCQELIDHLANEVLGEKGMGSKIAYLLQEEEEHEFDKPSLKHFCFMLTDSFMLTKTDGIT